MRKLEWKANLGMVDVSEYVYVRHGCWCGYIGVEVCVHAHIYCILRVCRVSYQISVDMNNWTHYNLDCEGYRLVYITKQWVRTVTVHASLDATGMQRCQEQECTYCKVRRY